MVKRDRLRTFMAILLEENDKYNLISRKATADDVCMHVEDALAACAFEDFAGLRVIDIGSGAGFPGIPMAIACPQGEFVLLESELKKCEFMVKVTEILGLDNVLVLRGRAEELGQDARYRENFDCGVARAVAELRVLLEYGLPLVKVGGRLLAWKGRNYPTEVEQGENALQVLGGHLAEIKKYTLGDSFRYLLYIKKTVNTPGRFPRRPGIPGKRPL